MPRKPKPSKELVIQALSTGEYVRERFVVDDLSGEMIETAEPYGPWLPPRDVDALLREKAEHKQAQAQALLAKAGWYGHEAKPNGPLRRRL